MRILTVLFIGLAFASSAENPEESIDGDHSRKILGSSVVTSVSVVMDNGNGSKTVYTDAVGKPMGRPSNGADLASPIDLLNPDRYEFYTFDDNGELIKRLMSLEEIKGIIATGDTDGLDFDAFTSQGYLPERRVNEVVNTVQNVLKEEIETHNKNTLDDRRPPYDTPDVSDSWSMILPAVFGNSGEDIKPDKPIAHVTPDTIMIEPNMQNILDTNVTSTSHSSYITPRSTSSTHRPTAHFSHPTLRSTTQQDEATSSGSEVVTKVPSLASSSTPKDIAKPTLDVEIFSNSKLTTSAPTEAAMVEVRVPTTLKPTTTTAPEPTTTTTPESTTTMSPEPTTLTATSEPTMTPSATTTSVKTPGTATTFTSWTTLPTTKASAVHSTVPTTETETAFTKLDRISTWRPDPEEKEEDVSKLPLLAHILGYNKIKGEMATTTLNAPIITFVGNDEKTTTESQGTTIPSATDKSEEDLSTLSSEHSGFKKTTTVPASTSLNQQQFSADPGEINTLSDYMTTEQRFKPTTTMKPFETTTVQPFVITVGDNSDKTIIGSIEQLLSQAVNNVEKVLVDANDTAKIHAMLNGTYNKIMNESEKETATFASNLVNKPAATTEPAVPAPDDSFNQSLESLISQISEPERFAVETTTNIPSTESSTGTTDVGTTDVTESTTLNDGGGATTIQTNSTTEQLRPKPAKSDLSLETWYDELNRTDIDDTATTEEASIMTQETSNLPLSTTYQYDTKERPTTVVIIKKTERPMEAEATTATMTPESATTITTEKTTESSPNRAEVSKVPQEETITDPDGTTWTLVSTIAPHAELPMAASIMPPLPEAIEPPVPIDLSANPMQGFGLEDTTSNLEDDVFQFAQLCNELAFGFWRTIASGLSSARSMVVSPFGATSLLAMVFLGARGATSGEMNEILKLDDVVTFNPHLIFKNVSESVRADEPDSGVAISAIVRELFADRSKGRLLPFYKERARAFYDGFVEEVGFKGIGDVIRRRTNLQVKKATGGRLPEFLRDSSIVARPPLTGVSVNIFHTDCSKASTDGRDGELYFVVLPSIRQRRLVPVPAVVYRRDFLAGYEPSLDATAVSVGHKDKATSTIFVMPGQQGMTAPGDGLARLEKRLVESSFKKGAWSRLLRSLIPRLNLDVQIPRFSHQSVINASATLQKMGLRELFDVDKADLRGLNGVPNELFLSDILQVNNFATCGERSIGDTHHSEIYPATGINARSARHLEQYLGEGSTFGFQQGPIDYQRAFHDPLHDPTSLNIPLSLRPRQARVPEVPRLRFDRPFLYFVRHNPTGLILHMGRFNPRLLP